MAEAPSSSSGELPVIPGQEYRVKLGKSFTFPRENSFHTMKYDFKPQSVDSTKPGRLKVSEDEVNVSLPVAQAETVEDVAQFRGPKKSCLKECILIIDTNTGEAILEKISNTVQLKVIRRPRDRSVSPSPFSLPHMSSKPQTAKSQLATSSSSSSHNPSPTLGKPPPPSSSSSSSQTKAKKTKKPSQPKPRVKSSPATAVTGNSIKSENLTSSVKPSSVATTSSTIPTISVTAKAPSTNSLPKQPRKRKSQKVSNSKKKNASITANTSNSVPNITHHSLAPPVNSAPATAVSYTTSANNSVPRHSMSGNLMPASSSVVGASMPLIGMELGHDHIQEISPIPSSNPTPEPIASKRAKVENDIDTSSSGSLSSSSDSDSDSGDNMVTNTSYLGSHVTSNPGHVTGHMMPAVSQSGISSSYQNPPQSMPVFHQTDPKPATTQRTNQNQPGGHMTHHMPQIFPGHLPRQRQPIGQSSSSSSGSDSESSSGSSSSDESSDSTDQANHEVAMYTAAAQRPPSPARGHTRQKSIDLGRDLALSDDSDSDL